MNSYLPVLLFIHRTTRYGSPGGSILSILPIDFNPILINNLQIIAIELPYPIHQAPQIFPAGLEPNGFPTILFIQATASRFLSILIKRTANRFMI